MRVKSWMTTKVITISPTDSMMKAHKLMKENNIRRLPVVDENNKLLGIVSDRDIKEASPSKATTLDVHELYYLLSEIKVKDIMTKSPISMRDDETVEKAAVILNEKHIGGMPVVNEENEVVGVITESDIFRLFIDITRVKDGGIQMGFQLTREPGALQPILKDITDLGGKVLSIITVYPPGDPDRKAYLRIAEMEKSQLNKIQEHLEANYNVLFWVRDNVHSIM